MMSPIPIRINVICVRVAAMYQAGPEWNMAQGQAYLDTLPKRPFLVTER